jgi:hypothetical protein
MAQSAMTTPKKRPVGATILAILAVIPAVLAVINLLQALGIFPYVIGPIQYRDFNLWYVLMWGVMAWIYIWLIRMLWRVEPAGWMFLVFISLWHLMLDFFILIGSATVSDVAASFVVNGLILIYCMLPGVREAFGTDMPG